MQDETALIKLDTSIRRRRWPWFLVGAFLVLGAIAIAIGLRAKWAREEHERAYPVVAHPANQTRAAQARARWQVPTLVAKLDALPALHTLTLTSRCELAEHDGLEVFDRETLERKVADLFEEAQRGRYRFPWDRERVMRLIDGPIVAVKISDSQAPNTGDASMQQVLFQHGWRAATAYVFDVDGALRCAGEFAARSSDHGDRALEHESRAAMRDSLRRVE